jgi:hypothetical protein
VCQASELPQLDARTAAEQFLKLRLAYAAKPDFSAGWVQVPEREALLKLYNSNPKEFLTQSSHWLKTCPVDAKVHLMRATLLLNTGDTEGHFYHRLMYYGLTASIVSSGDGKTAKTAYQVISVDEEYTVLNHIGAKVITQTLQYPCDVMQVEIEGKPTTLFFDVSISMAALKRQLDKPKPKAAERPGKNW